MQKDDKFICSKANSEKQHCIDCPHSYPHKEVLTKFKKYVFSCTEKEDCSFSGEVRCIKIIANNK